MRKLLSAGFMRLRKNKAFYLCTLFMFLLGAYAVLIKYFDDARYAIFASFETALFAYAAITGGCAAIFCSLFIGTEYSDGTLRNKLIVGHSRVHIYCVHALVSFAATLIMTFAYLVPYFALGLPLLGAPTLSWGTIAMLFACSVFTSAAFVSLFTLLATLISNRAVSAVVCLVVFLALLALAIVIDGKLHAPEWISDYMLTLNGVEQSAPVPNSHYLKGAKRAVYEFIYDFLPSGQSLQLSSLSAAHPLRMALCSLFLCVTTLLGGMAAFCRKDIQ